MLSALQTKLHNSSENFLAMIQEKCLSLIETLRGLFLSSLETSREQLLVIAQELQKDTQAVSFAHVVSEISQPAKAKRFSRKDFGLKGFQKSVSYVLVAMILVNNIFSSGAITAMAQEDQPADTSATNTANGTTEVKDSNPVIFDARTAEEKASDTPKTGTTEENGTNPETGNTNDTNPGTDTAGSNTGTEIPASGTNAPAPQQTNPTAVET